MQIINEILGAITDLPSSNLAMKKLTKEYGAYRFSFLTNGHTKDGIRFFVKGHETDRVIISKVGDEYTVQSFDISGEPLFEDVVGLDELKLTFEMAIL